MQRTDSMEFTKNIIENKDKLERLAAVFVHLGGHPNALKPVVKVVEWNSAEEEVYDTYKLLLDVHFVARVTLSVIDEEPIDVFVETESPWIRPCVEKIS